MMARPRKKPAWIEVAASLFAEKIGMPYEHRRLITSEQMMSLARIDHDPEPHSEGGPDLHYNLTVRTIMDHAEKTAKIDVPGIAKRKRVTESWDEHKAKIAAKGTPPAEPNPLTQQQRRAKFEFMKATMVENVGEDQMAFPKNRSRSRTKREKKKGFGR